MNKLSILLFFALSISFSQSKGQKETETNKEIINKTYAFKGITFNIGDTLAFNELKQYFAIVKGIKNTNGDLITQPITYSLKNTKCIISEFKDNYGLTYTYCKSLGNQYYRLMLDVAIIQGEVVFNPPRQIPKDYIPFNFQGVNWGYSMNEVRVLFPNSKKLSDEFLTDEALINTFDSELLFRFNNDKLNTILYSFKVEHSNKNIYIEDYLSIKSLLIQKYGKPKSDSKNWRDNLYRDNYQEYGFAISIGDLEYVTEWELPDADIKLKLFGDNYEIKHILGYSKFPKDKKTMNNNETLNKL